MTARLVILSFLDTALENGLRLAMPGGVVLEDTSDHTGIENEVGPSARARERIRFGDTVDEADRGFAPFAPRRGAALDLARGKSCRLLVSGHGSRRSDEFSGTKELRT